VLRERLSEHRPMTASLELTVAADGQVRGVRQAGKQVK
jgi:hypothetical protein